MRLALEKISAGKAVEALHLNVVEDGWLAYGITKAKEKLTAGK